MAIHFSKMHGLGNDFVMIDGVRQSLPPALLSPDTIRTLADRRRGIGCDQLLILQAPPADGAACAEGADFYYRIFNADGGEVGQCMNGVRCAHAFARRRGLSDKTVLTLQTLTTRMATAQEDEKTVRATLLTPPQYQGATRACGYDFHLWDTGNPHAVCLSAHLDAADDDTVAAVGKAMNERIDGGINVGFAECGAARMRLVVYERGAGMTAACGSGALAAALAAIKEGIYTAPVTVDMPGGTLRCGQSDDGAWLEGEINHVFDGELNPPEAR